MNKRKKRLISACVIIAVILSLVGTSVWLIIRLSRQKDTGEASTAFVSYGTLYSTISSSGTVTELAVSADIPLAAAIYDIKDLEELESMTFEVNWATVLLNPDAGPLAYRVDEIAEEISDGRFSVTEQTETVALVKLVPVYFDLQAYVAAFEQAKAAGKVSDDEFLSFAMSVLFGSTSGSPSHTVSKEFLIEDPSRAVTVTTAYPSSVLEETTSVRRDELAYKISRVTYKEGDYLTLESTLFSVTYAELFVSYAVSEYDYADIDARMRAGESIYAAVSINALGGRKGLAKIIEMHDSTSTSGVTYYTLLAKLIFADLSQVTEDEPYGDYTFYDPELTEEYLARLGLAEDEPLLREEIVDDYTVTVTSQKKAIPNTLIVPTKCIFYDSANKPYVLRIDENEKGKEVEKRIYVRISLSTGTEAAIVPLDGQLSESDRLRFYSESSLLGSLF